MKTIYMALLSLCCMLPLLAAEAPVISDKAVLPDKVRLFTVVVDDFWQTNCYIFVGENNESIIIDPGDELDYSDEKLLVDIETGKSHKATKEELERSDGDAVVDQKTGKKQLVYTMWRGNGKDTARIYKVIQENKLKVKYIILSHGHIDHIASLNYLKKMTDAKIMMHAGDIRGKDGSKLNFDVPKLPVGYPKDAYTLEGGTPKVDQILKEGDLITCGGMTFQVLHTPGHSPGGISLVTRYKGVMHVVSGDILLRHTIGRTNFRDGSGDEALEARMIREKLYGLPDNTVVLPGHYDFTTIGDEKVNNMFVPEKPVALPPLPAQENNN